MINNVTDRLANSTQPALSLACPFLGEFGWQQEYLTPTTFIILVVVVCVEMPMCLVTILLNVLVILAVKRKRYLRKQKSCVLLACLAATDFIVGAFVVPLVIISHILRLSEGGPVCLLDKIAVDSMYITCGASLYHLVIISGERYVAIKHALRYETLVTTRRLTIAVAVAWAIPIIFTTAINIKVENYSFQEEIENVATQVCIPGSVAVITFFQVAVFLETRRHRKHIRAHQVSEAVASEILKKDKAARTTAMVVVALCICYAPPTLHQATILTVQNVSKRIVWGSFFLVELLVYFNSLLNPVIYCMRTQDFKRAFRELLNLSNNPQGNQELEMHRIGHFARQQRNSKAQLETSHKETGTAWLHDTRRPRDSRARSLDLFTDPSQLHKTRRNNSV